MRRLRTFVNSAFSCFVNHAKKVARLLLCDYRKTKLIVIH